MNKCPVCGTTLVSHELVHVVQGKMYCRKSCAVKAIMAEFLESDYMRQQYILGKAPTADVLAEEFYNDYAEVVDTDSVLDEDLQEVQIAVTYYKTVKMPKNMSKDEVLAEVESLWNDGVITAEPCDHDDVRFECGLVNDNSAHEEIDSNE